MYEIQPRAAAPAEPTAATAPPAKPGWRPDPLDQLVIGAIAVSGAVGVFMAIVAAIESLALGG